MISDSEPLLNYPFKKIEISTMKVQKEIHKIITFTQNEIHVICKNISNDD